MNNTNDWLPFLEWDSVNLLRSGGIALDMINDQERNVFYEKIISWECKDRVCADIGAGNGLLTFLAIKHGAKHVYCVEADPYTCNLLREMSIELGFFDKITIINKIFKLSDFDSYVWAQGKPEIIIHELVSSKIFNQVPGSLTDAINCNINDLTIVPGEYGCDIFSVNINKNVFDKIVNQSKQHVYYRTGQVDFVKTGVSSEFDQALQKYRTDFLKLPYKQMHIDNIKAKIVRKNCEFVGKFNFNINEEKEFPNVFSLNFKPINQYRILFLHFKLKHNNLCLDFDFTTNTSFGQGEIYVIEPMINTVNIDTKKGAIWFEQNG